MSSLTEFQDYVTNTLWPEFKREREETIMDQGFRPNWERISEFDAFWFLKAMHADLMTHKHKGLYQAPLSGATELFFWSGQKKFTPRPFFLSVEPIITVGALGRLHFEFGWPLGLLGTQQMRWEFDLSAFEQPDRKHERISCEVKKTEIEVDDLVRNMKDLIARDLTSEVGLSSRQINALRKVKALHARTPTFFWAVGPSNYGKVFELNYLNGLELYETDISKLNWSQLKSE